MHVVPAFDTAVFIDLENLLCGYSLNEEAMEKLNLEGVLEQVKLQEGYVGRTAIARAYANWQSYKTRPLHAVMNKLNISQEHVQAVNASQKNLADIALCTDVMDVLHTRPNIRTFVIVSGDGGFAWLVRRLNEYGKNVIIAAYESQTNDVLRQLADVFLGIEDPRGVRKEEYVVQDAQLKLLLGQFSKLEATRASLPDLQDRVREIFSALPEHESIKQTLNLDGLPLPKLEGWFKELIPGFDYHSIFGHIKFVDFVKHHAAAASTHFLLKQIGNDFRLEFKDHVTAATTVSKIREVVDLDELKTTVVATKTLTRGNFSMSNPKELMPVLTELLDDMMQNPAMDFGTGVAVSKVEDYVLKALPQLNPFALGANGITHLMAQVLYKRDLSIYDNHSKWVISFDDTCPKGFHKVTLPPLNPVHSVENYKNALADSTNKWFFVITSPTLNRKVAEFILKKRNTQLFVKEWLEKAKEALAAESCLTTLKDEKERHNAVLNTLMAFNASSLFIKTPENAKLDSQKLELAKDVISASTMLEKLKVACKTKLEKTMGIEIDPEVLKQVVG